MSNGSASIWVLALTVVAIVYAIVALPQLRRGRWTRGRIMLWYGGMALVALAVTGPIADRGHDDFWAHMLTHLLLGMAAPVLLTLSAPVTLLLRALPVRGARRVVRVLGARPVRLATHLATAAVLNIAGMWLLYTTTLYRLMVDSPLIGTAVQIHILLTGYLFTAAAIGIDPMPHRPNWTVRASILIAAFAGHSILARSLYAHPPEGVSQVQAEPGSRIMYYGGDLIEVGVIAVFCWQWYRATRPRPLPGAFATRRAGAIPITPGATGPNP